MALRDWLTIAAGGALGAVSRAAVSLWLNPKRQGAFPWGTLTVNLVGSIALGMVVGLYASDRLSSAGFKAFFATGFCGAFTTFSTFSVESVQLLRHGSTGTAAAYVGLNLSLCLIGAAIGIAITR